MTLKVGVLGVGRIGQVHLSTLAGIPGVECIIIFDVIEPLLKDVAAKFNVPSTTTNADDVINHPDVNAVWICSPSQFHADQIKACAKAKKHIFCEKPLATDLQGTYDAVIFAEKCGVKLMTAFQRRFDPSFARLHDIVAKGEIGQPLSAILISRDTAPPPIAYVKGGGGVFKDQAIHDLDVARWMMGANGKNDPVKVYATGSCLVQPEVKSLKESNPSEAIDTINILLEFESGSTATIQCCRKTTYGYDQRVEVFGTNGLAKLDNVHPTTTQKWGNAGIARTDLPYDFFMDRYKDAYANETKAFAEMLQAGVEVSPTGYDGMAALELAIACDLSYKEGRPVLLSEVKLVK